MGMREKGQADWDLERCIELFDEALISKDERVVNALRSLLMIVSLTAPESAEQSIDGRIGPLRQLMSEHNDLSRRVGRLDGEIQEIKHILRQNNTVGVNGGGSYIDTGAGKYYGGGGIGGFSGYIGPGGISDDVTAKAIATKAVLMAGLNSNSKDIK